MRAFFITKIGERKKSGQNSFISFDLNKKESEASCGEEKKRKEKKVLLSMIARESIQVFLSFPLRNVESILLRCGWPQPR